MSVQSVELDEYCPSCGNWVHPHEFDHSTGWCSECSPQSQRCSRCGNEMHDDTRGVCRACRQEQWLEQWADELEFLIVVKQYSVPHARMLIIRMSRPICQWCRKPIVGWNNGTMFHGRNHTNRECHRRYRMFVRLHKRGLSMDEALRLTLLDRRDRLTNSNIHPSGR